LVNRARRCQFALTAVALAVCLAGAALAEPTAAEVAVARKAFADATELEREKKWAEAESKLREAIAIKETPGLRYHLGFCLENQHKLVEALVEYDRAEEMLRLGAKAPDVSELLGPAREGVKKRAANITLELPAKVDGVVIELDGVPVKAALVGKAVPQNPGKRVITASAPGRQPFRREIELAEGESRELTIDLPEKTAAAGPAAAAGTAAARKAGDPPAAQHGTEGSASASLDSATPTSARTYVLVGEAAFTVLALGAGVFFQLKADKSQGEVDEANAELDKFGYRNNNRVCLDLPTNSENACGRLPVLTEQRDRDVNLSRASFIGAGVGAVATVATFFLWKPPDVQQGRSARQLTVAPVLAKDACGFGLGGRF